MQFNSVTRAYFQAIAPLQDEETSKWMRSLDTSDRGEHAARVISNDNPAWNAMLHDTVAPTMLRAGIRPNVIPSEARGVAQRPPASGKSARRRFSRNCSNSSTIPQSRSSRNCRFPKPLRPPRSRPISTTRLSQRLRAKTIPGPGRSDDVHLLHRFRSRCACAACKPTECFRLPRTKTIFPAFTRTTNASRSTLFTKESNFSTQS